MLKDITNQQFNKLFVLKEVERLNGKRRYLCLCNCGVKKEIAMAHIISGKTLSCGCHKKEINTTHGLSNTRLYQIWADMLSRCKNIKHKWYRSYGLKGILVDSSWEIFENFNNWALSSGYSSKLTLDRKDNLGNYCPENCRWVTKTTQVRNRNKTCKNTSSKYIGVSFSTNCRKSPWVSYITINKKRHTIGYFKDEFSAAKARNEYIVLNNLQDFTLNIL